MSLLPAVAPGGPDIVLIMADDMGFSDIGIRPVKHATNLLNKRHSPDPNGKVQAKEKQ